VKACAKSSRWDHLKAVVDFGDQQVFRAPRLTRNSRILARCERQRVDYAKVLELDDGEVHVVRWTMGGHSDAP